MVNQFIGKLLDNPNFAGQPLTMKELHICNFVQQNTQNLAPVLTGQQFFPGVSPQDAADKLITQIRRLIAEQVLNGIKVAIPNAIDFSIHQQLEGHFDIGDEELMTSFFTMYEKTIAHREVRQRLDFLSIILNERLIDKYLLAAYEEKSYIYNEMFRIEKHRFEPNLAIDYLKLSALLVPGYFIKLNIGGGNEVNGFDLRDQGQMQQRYFEKADQVLKSLVKQLHEDFWVTAKSALVDYSADPDQDPGGKLLSIMFMRARDYRVNQKREKGAETPDKSWFSIQIRNASHLGLDKNMLENLNRIAFSLRY